jgi:hypothetical protein
MEVTMKTLALTLALLGFSTAANAWCAYGESGAYNHYSHTWMLRDDAYLCYPATPAGQLEAIALAAQLATNEAQIFRVSQDLGVFAASADGSAAAVALMTNTGYGYTYFFSYVAP